jgi:hypothetical protein
MPRGFTTISACPKKARSKDVEPDPPRLFRGYKRVVENPEDYKDFEGLVKLYNSIFKLR